MLFLDFFHFLSLLFWNTFLWTVYEHLHGKQAFTVILQSV
jgi:hypothetical protein